MAKCKTPEKPAYPTWKAATAALLRHKTPTPLMTYKCPQCHKWHISSHSQRPARRK